MIEITLTFRDKQIDLLVPGRVTFERLHRLLADAFAEKGTLLPPGFVLSCEGKALNAGGADYVSSFGVGDGDELLILSKE